MQAPLYADYRKAVDGFKWPGENQEPSWNWPISPYHLQEVVGEVVMQIDLAKTVKGPQGNLKDTLYYLAAEGETKKLEGKIIDNITEASEKEAKAARCVFQKIAKDYEDLPADDLQCATLLFGINKIHNLHVNKA